MQITFFFLIPGSTWEYLEWDIQTLGTLKVFVCAERGRAAALSPKSPATAGKGWGFLNLHGGRYDSLEGLGANPLSSTPQGLEML